MKIIKPYVEQMTPRLLMVSSSLRRSNEPVVFVTKAKIKLLTPRVCLLWPDLLRTVMRR